MDPFTVKKISGFTHVPIYAHILDKLDTQSILEDTELSSKIKKTGDSLIGMLERNGVNSLEELMGYSYIFAEDSQLLYHASLDTILKEINADGSIATMIMLGKSFFSLKIIPGLSLKHLKISNERTYYL